MASLSELVSFSGFYNSLKCHNLVLFLFPRKVDMLLERRGQEGDKESSTEKGPALSSSHSSHRKCAQTQTKEREIYHPPPLFSLAPFTKSKYSLHSALVSAAKRDRYNLINYPAARLKSIHGSKFHDHKKVSRNASSFV